LHDLFLRRDWYSTVKSAVIDSSDHCNEDFACELLVAAT
jgi:hypothetical protein